VGFETSQEFCSMAGDAGELIFGRTDHFMITSEVRNLASTVAKMLLLAAAEPPSQRDINPAR
jgi:hypothetical protein